MRHTYASHLVMRGVSLRIIRDLLGHSKISTTMIYAYLSPEHIQEAVASLPY
ncbi:MAG: tyrosine-type recombinase/integrase [Candidatus Margulisbacteria bacterium]|nr:tyrosine-type recombinase/integrase [Candidatus Margulisiibacteriota bacterium]